MKIVEARNCEVCYHRKHPVIKDLSFDLEKGDFLSILGVNGVGKTTLIKTLIGFLELKTGSITLNGEPIKQGKKMSRTISYVPQKKKVPYGYLVIDMVCLGRAHENKWFRIGKKDREVAYNVLKNLDIEHLAEKKCNELSGGQLGMVYIARALAREPKLLILDEPEANLDFRNQVKLIKILRKVNTEFETTCILNTHSLESAQYLSNKTLLLGKNGYKFGRKNEMLTEKNIYDYFNVKTKIVESQVDSVRYKSFVLLPGC